MIKALQSSARAMSLQRQRHELIANNLANVNTPGFKRLVARVREVGPAAGPALSPPSPDSVSRLQLESLTQNGNGALQATGNPLDVALVGDGYFLVETAQGPRLSRDGSFSLSASGELIHASGNPVMAGGSAVVLRDEPSILSDGSILDGNRLVGRLSLVKPPEGAGLMREGNNLLRSEVAYEEVPEGETKVVSGHVESSTVDAVGEMVEMIRAFRAYEIAQKAAQAADDTLRVAVERVGVLRA